MPYNVQYSPDCYSERLPIYRTKHLVMLSTIQYFFMFQKSKVVAAESLPHSSFLGWHKTKKNDIF